MKPTSVVIVTETLPGIVVAAVVAAMTALHVSCCNGVTPIENSVSQVMEHAGCSRLTAWGGKTSRCHGCTGDPAKNHCGSWRGMAVTAPWALQCNGVTAAAAAAAAAAWIHNLLWFCLRCRPPPPASQSKFLSLSLLLD